MRDRHIFLISKFLFSVWILLRHIAALSLKTFKPTHSWWSCCTNMKPAALLALLTQFVIESVALQSLEECRSLGFHTPTLLCSSCDDIQRFDIKDKQVITNNCRDCCTDDGKTLESRESKYPKAILEVCGWRFGASRGNWYVNWIFFQYFKTKAPFIPNF